MATPTSQQQQQMTNMAKKTPLLSSMMTERANGPQQQGMMGSPMGPVGHMPQSHLPAQVNQGGYMQQVTGLFTVSDNSYPKQYPVK
jgi:hypothetical protein